jgi:energy-coupling factor transporter ATP-binding protein EcfA2
MRIEKINLPEEVTKGFALAPVKMDRLGKLVLLAGKNGAGKTRFLELLKKEFGRYPLDKRLAELRTNRTSLKKRIADLNEQILKKELEIATARSMTQESLMRREIQRKQKSILENESALTNIEKDLEIVSSIEINPGKTSGALVDFVPKSLQLTDSYELATSQKEQNFRKIYRIGMTELNQSAISAIEIIQKRWANINSTFAQEIELKDEERKRINDDYAKLKSYIQIFLNTNLSGDVDGNPLLFGRRIGQTQLSEGQKILLQFCVGLYAQEIQLDKLIILMDEPENHLHPAALIEVLDKITANLKEGQLWIATHSINILAHFDPSLIWYIEDGKISYAGRIPQKVLQGLLGKEEEIEKLSNFLALPEQMANNLFSYECLFNPQVLFTPKDDPQVAQIHEIIKKLQTSSKKLKILDFGMGKGRLLSTIFENEKNNNISLSGWLDFFGYDISAEHKASCETIFEEIYGSAENRYFNTTKEMLSKLDESSFDIIIMCNVFHEIDPKEWSNLFSSVNSPFKLLKPEGYLIIVEDQLLAIGEKAHSKGFLVYDSMEFKKLFRIKAADNYSVKDQRGDGRLKAHFIPAIILGRTSKQSIHESLEVLNQNAKDEIKRLRQQDPSFKSGKQMGFWSQQLANSALALEEL